MGKFFIENREIRECFDALPVEEAPDFVPYASKFPGISHKCGHDGHSAALAAFALDLEENGADKNVYLIFQHAEEKSISPRSMPCIICRVCASAPSPRPTARRSSPPPA